MAVYRGEICNYLYDEDREETKWEDLTDDWICPVCGSTKSYFKLVKGGETEVGDANSITGKLSEEINRFKRQADELEICMVDIHKMASTGESIIELMRTQKPAFTWDDILIKGAQLANPP